MSEQDTKETEQKIDRVERVGMPEMAPPLFVVCFIICIFASSIASYRYGYLRSSQEAQIDKLREISEGNEVDEVPDGIEVEWDHTPVEEPAHEQTLPQALITQNMQELYDINPDVVGWLTVDDMNIDYPVMQTMDDEEYYLNRDFQGRNSANGCLIMDTDSSVGTGTLANEYADGTKPSTNLIIHGHNMKNGDMFGNLDLYRKEDFYQDHKIIKLQTLYEDREYEVMSVFLSQVYLKSQTDVFKYYKFFDANNQDEFNDFYKNVKKLALYDTGVKASYGDEFITLSVCAYHVENGRLVVVGKRIK